jgi:L-ascorbate metabolism protein UlaG (beta-lactamase superfamily)
MANPYYKGPISDHFDGDRFYNEDSVAADKNLFDVLRWSFTRKPVPWPKSVGSPTGIRPDIAVQGLRITLIGHASLLIQANGVNVLVDPVWAERASPVSFAGPRRFTPPAIHLQDLPTIHTILVTHNHYDHLDLKTIHTLWQRDRPQIIVPLGNDTILRKGHPEIEAEAGDWWESFPMRHGLKATIVPAYHWSSRRMGDHRKALWGGFILETPSGVVYCVGDTAYRDGEIFREVGHRFGPPLVAIVPIGAYAPRDFMKPQHADPEEAATIARDCGAKHALGIHWGTFHFSDESIDEPGTRFSAALAAPEAKPLSGKPLAPGDTWDYVEPHDDVVPESQTVFEYRRDF